MVQILIISDDSHLGRVLIENIGGCGYQCDSVQSDADIPARLALKEYDLIFCHTQLKETSGFELIRSILDQYPRMAAIMVANQIYPDMAEKITNSGAFDFIPVPVEPDRVKISLKNALFRLKIENENKSLQNKLNKSDVKHTRTVNQYKDKIGRLLEQIEFVKNQITHAEKMATIGQLAAGVAHEINNPVGYVASNLNTLQHYQRSLMATVTQYRKLVSDITNKKTRLKQEPFIAKRIVKIENLQTRFDLDYLRKDTLVLIKESISGISRVKKIVRDLKIFVHPGQEYPELIDIHKHLDATLNLVRNQIKYGIKIEKEYGDLPPVKCWVGQLVQVFLNIIVNAIQAIGKKGIISIKTKSCEDDCVEIQIRDTGHGILEKNLTKIFDLFFTTKPAGKGTGLGLHMSNNIVKKQKGTLMVKSQVGSGSTFTIRIPIDCDTAL